MYYDYAGREVEDPEMDNMVNDRIAELRYGIPAGSMSDLAIEAAHSDRAALLAWENAITDASTRGEAWVQEARHLYCFVLFALQRAEAAGVPTLLESLRPALAEAEALQTERSATFRAWADEAWNLPDLAPLPAAPWG